MKVNLSQEHSGFPHILISSKWCFLKGLDKFKQGGSANGPFIHKGNLHAGQIFILSMRNSKI